MIPEDSRKAARGCPLPASLAKTAQLTLFLCLQRNTIPELRAAPNLGPLGYRARSRETRSCLSSSAIAQGPHGLAEIVPGRGLTRIRRSILFCPELFSRSRNRTARSPGHNFSKSAAHRGSLRNASGQAIMQENQSVKQRRLASTIRAHKSRKRRQVIDRHFSERLIVLNLYCFQLHRLSRIQLRIWRNRHLPHNCIGRCTWHSRENHKRTTAQENTMSSFFCISSRTLQPRKESSPKALFATS